MTEMQSAIGRVALRKVPGLGGDPPQLRRHVQREAGSGSPGYGSRATGDSYHAYYKYYAFVRPGAPAAGLESRSHPAGDDRRRRALFGRQLQRSVPGKGVRKGGAIAFVFRLQKNWARPV